MTEDGGTPVVLRHSSNSEIATWLDCRRRWWLAYSLRVSSVTGEASSGPLWIGTIVHIGHDARFKALKWGATNEQSIKVCFFAIKAAVHRRTLMGQQVDHNEVELGVIMLAGYWEWETEEGILAEFEILDTEVELSMPVVLRTTGEVVEYWGKIDVIARHKETGFMWVIDKKTVGSLSEPAFGLQRSTQMLGYIMLLTHAMEEHVDGAMYSMLRKVKRTRTANPPFYAHVEVRYNKTEHARYAIRLRETLQDIMEMRDKLEPYNKLDRFEEAAQIAYPTPTGDCSWKCEYVGICSLFDDGSRVGDVLAEKFVSRDPMARYKLPHGEESKKPDTIVVQTQDGGQP